MPSLTLPDRLIWFAHCPKTGGTSIETLMVETWGWGAVGHLHWGWDRWWRQGGWREDGPANSPQHLTWQDAQPVLPRAPDSVFAVVRDPMRRLESEYRWQRRRQHRTRIGKLLSVLPFSLWLRVMLRVAARNPYAFDNHLRPQSDFVPDGATVFRLEDGLSAVSAWLAQQTGRPLEAPPHRLATGVSASASPGDLRLVEGVFAVDYARFGYAGSGAGNHRRPLLDALAACLAPTVEWLDRRGAF